MNNLEIGKVLFLILDQGPQELYKGGADIQAVNKQQLATAFPTTCQKPPNVTKSCSWCMLCFYTVPLDTGCSSSGCYFKVMLLR